MTFILLPGAGGQAWYWHRLLPLLGDDQDFAVKLAVESLNTFRDRYTANHWAGLRAKLGLTGVPESAVQWEIGQDLLELLRHKRVDWTRGFRALGSAARGNTGPIHELFGDPSGLDEWLVRWRELGPDPVVMDRTNPLYIPRNHLVEEALESATAGDLVVVQRLLEAVQHPYDERPGRERYAAPADDDFGRYITYCGT